MTMSIGAELAVAIVPKLLGISESFGPAGTLAGAAMGTFAGQALGNHMARHARKAGEDAGSEAAEAFGEQFSRGMQGGRVAQQISSQLGDAFQGLGGRIAENVLGEFNRAVSGQVPNLEDIIKPFDMMEEAITAPIMNTIGKLPILGDALKETKSWFDTFQAGSADFIQTLVDVGDSYIEMSRKIAASTPDVEKIGELTNQVREIAATGVVAHVGDVASAIGRLNENIQGLSSEQLKELTSNFAQAEEVVGRIDPTKFAGVVNAWGVGAEGANDMLTKLANTAIISGQNINQTMAEMANAGPAFRALGYNAEQTAAFFNMMTKEGDTAGRSVFAFTKVYEQFIKQGVDPKEGMKNLITAIKDLVGGGDIEEASKLAFERFGQRGGAYILDAIRRGMLDIPEMMQGLEGVSQPLGELAEKTKSLGDAFEILGRQFQAALEPIGMYLAKGIVNWSSQISQWLQDNQDKIARGVTEITHIVLKGAQDTLRFFGDMLMGFSAFVNPMKEIFIGFVGSVTTVMDGLLHAMSALPDWAGGKSFRDAAQAMDDANKELNKLEHTDLGNIMYRISEKTLDFANNTMPGAIAKVDELGNSMANNLQITELMSTKVNGELKPAFEILRDAQGKALAGTGEEPTALQLLGNPAQWQSVATQLEQMGFKIQYNAGGVVTAITNSNKSFMDAWDKWYEEQTKTPKEVPLKVKPLGPDGEEAKDSGDLVKPGQTTVDVLPKGVSGYTPGGIPLPSLPPGVSLPGIPSAGAAGAPSLPFGAPQIGPAGAPGMSIPIPGEPPHDPGSIARYIFQAATARGYTPQQATALVAYAYGESGGLQPTISGGVQGGQEVIGLFQEQAQFAQAVGVDPSLRSTVAGNVEAYLRHLEQFRNLPFETVDTGALARTSVGGPLSSAGLQNWPHLMQQAMGLLGGATAAAPSLPTGTPQSPVTVTLAPTSPLGQFPVSPPAPSPAPSIPGPQIQWPTTGPQLGQPQWPTSIPGLPPLVGVPGAPGPAVAGEPHLQAVFPGPGPPGPPPGAAGKPTPAAPKLPDNVAQFAIPEDKWDPQHPPPVPVPGGGWMHFPDLKAYLPVDKDGKVTPPQPPHPPTAADLGPYAPFLQGAPPPQPPPEIPSILGPQPKGMRDIAPSAADEDSLFKSPWQRFVERQQRQAKEEEGPGWGATFGKIPGQVGGVLGRWWQTTPAGGGPPTGETFGREHEPTLAERQARGPSTGTGFWDQPGKSIGHALGAVGGFIGHGVEQGLIGAGKGLIGAADAVGSALQSIWTPQFYGGGGNFALGGKVGAFGTLNIQHSLKRLGFAEGGEMDGNGGEIPWVHRSRLGEDSMWANVEPHEYIVRATQARKHRRLLDQINAGTGMYFQGGGSVYGSAAYAQNPATGDDVMGVIPEILGVLAVAHGYGLKLTAGRSGHGTHSMDRGFHDSGEAGDFSNGVGTMEEAALATYLASNFKNQIEELIHFGPGWDANYNIKSGRFVGEMGGVPNVYDAGTLNDHRDHVHVAIIPGHAPALAQAGGGVQPGTFAATGASMPGGAPGAQLASYGAPSMGGGPGGVGGLGGGGMGGSMGAQPAGGGQLGQVGPGGPIAQGFYDPWYNVPPGLSARGRAEFTSGYEQWQLSQATTAAAPSTAQQALTDAQGKQAIASQNATTALNTYNELVKKVNEAKDPMAMAAALKPDLDAATAKVTQTQGELATANADVTNKQRELGTAIDRQTIEAGKPPPKPPGEAEKAAPGAEQLGRGFVKGIFQELGFPDVFGKAPYEWGISKLFTGALGWGLGMLGNQGVEGTGMGTGFGTPGIGGLGPQGGGFLQGMLGNIPGIGGQGGLLRNLMQPPGISGNLGMPPLAQQSVGPIAMYGSQPPAGNLGVTVPGPQQGGIQLSQFIQSSPLFQVGTPDMQAANAAKNTVFGGVGGAMNPAVGAPLVNV